MDRDLFEHRFVAAATCARDFARRFILEPLPDPMRFNVHLNASYDGAADPKFKLFPEDSRDEVALRTKDLTTGQVVALLWRDGLVPQWVNLIVVGETGDATLIDVVACGRFIGDEKALYYTWTELAPFGPKGPWLPVGRVEGQRFSIYNHSACWSLEDLARVMRHANRIWSLDLCGPAFDDDHILDALESSSLEILEVRGGLVRGPGLRSLSRLPKLRVLRMTLGKVDTLSLLDLPRSEQLTDLSIENVPCFVRGIECLIEATPKLSSLSLGGHSDVEAEAVTLPPTLTELRLGFPGVPSWIVPGRSLRTLSLRAEGSNDEEVTALLLQAPRDLESLHLSGTPVSDALFDVLARFAQLQYLDVVDTNVSIEALQRFTSARPGLRFHPRPHLGS